MNSRLYPRLAGLLAATALLLNPGLRAADEEHETDGATARVKFTDQGIPGTLKLSIPWAELHITGTDGNEVIVSSSLDQKGRAEVDDEGFRRLDEDVTFELTEKNNVAVVTVAGDNAWASHGAEFVIKVPRNTNLVLRTSLGGEILVDGVEGDLDINSMNGEVTLRDIASSAVVNTLNGEISASFKRAPVKPVSLSTLNGEIDVRLPADTQANLRMRTHNGSIRTNFPDKALQTKTEKVTGPGVPVAADSDDVHRELSREQARINKEAARVRRDAAKATADAAKAAIEASRDAIEAAVEASVNASVNVNLDGAVPPVPPVPPIPPLPNFGGKSIVGALNGGGVDIKLTSMNGTITLRQAK
jgi:hypothetical protein